MVDWAEYDALRSEDMARYDRQRELAAEFEDHFADCCPECGRVADEKEPCDECRPGPCEPLTPTTAERFFGDDDIPF